MIIYSLECVQHGAKYTIISKCTADVSLHGAPAGAGAGAGALLPNPNWCTVPSSKTRWERKLCCVFAD